MENSFYDLDYIITLGEKRVDLYQKVHLVYQKKIVNCVSSSNFYA